MPVRCCVVNVLQPPFCADNRKKTVDAILKDKLNIPGYLTPDSRDLIRRLMKRQVSQRLGSGPTDGQAVRAHPFFKNVNWDDVVKRRLDPPIKPVLVSAPEGEQVLTFRRVLRRTVLFLSYHRPVRMMCRSLIPSSRKRFRWIRPMKQR